MPSYKETIEYLYGLKRLGIRPGLALIKALLGRLGEPQAEYPTVHVAGTNGKGSCSAMIESVLTEAGFRTGLFTSPHLSSFNERIRVNGKHIANNEVIRVAARVKEACKGPGLLGPPDRLCPTFFEFSTAMALEYFRKKRVDLAILETGMGGRLDSTNVTAPQVSVITSIGYDHKEHLGTTLAKIAGEKAGIIRPSGIVVSAAQRPTVQKVLKRVSRKKHAALLMLGTDFHVKPRPGGLFDYSGIACLNRLRLNLDGPFQRENAALALAAVEVLKSLGYDIPVRAMRRGLKRVEWPGRVETVRKRPLVILDSAHNPDGARALKEALEGFSYSRLVLVIGAMGDKDLGGMLKHLAPSADTVILTTPKQQRAAPAAALLKALRPYKKKTLIKKDVPEAVAEALKQAAKPDAILITGSIFTVGEARDYLGAILERTFL
jgi:dihydrofolate synthase/folylpolyglutamate synthase